MAWIELHQSIRDNKKIMRLASLLSVGEVTATGHLVYLWLWALDNAPNGNLSSLTPFEIAKAAGFFEKNIKISEKKIKKSENFLKNLIFSGFIDEKTLEIHDWFVYAGRLIAQREFHQEQSNERVKRYREKIKKGKNTECNADVTRYGNAHVTQCNAATLPNLTLPKVVVVENVKLPADELEKMVGKVFKSFHENISATPGVIQYEEINHCLDDGLSPELILEVIKDSVGAKYNKWSLLQKILKECVNNNIKAIDQYNARKAERENAKSRDKPQQKSKVEQREEAYQKAQIEAIRKLKEEGVITDDEDGSTENNRSP